MEISKKGIDFIKGFEGCKLVAYRDIAGVWTIGFGHTLGVSPTDHITYDDALKLLREDLRVYEKCINKSVKVELTQYEFDALVSFCFNVGCGAFQNSTLLRFLNAKDFKNASDEFKRWIFCNKKACHGLYNRRVKERNLFITGEYN